MEAQQNLDIKVIRKKYISWLIGDSVDYTKPEVMQKYNAIHGTNSSILSLMNVSNLSLTNPGPVYNFNLNADMNAFWSVTEGKLLKLCMIYHMQGPTATPNIYFHSPQLKDSILKIFNYLKLKGIDTPLSLPPYIVYSEESIALGSHVLIRFSSYAMSVLLMRNELKQANLLTTNLNALKDATWFFSPSNPNYTFQFQGFSADGVRALMPARLAYVLAQDTLEPDIISNMQHFSQILNNACKIAPGWSDFIKPGYVTYHHLGTYMTNYGNNALQVAANMASVIDNSIYELDTASVSNLYNTMLTFIRFSNKYDMPRGISGRFPSAVNGSLMALLPATAYIYNCDTLKYKQMAREFMRIWGQPNNSLLNGLFNAGSNAIQITNTLGMMKPIMDLKQKNFTAATDASGHWGYPYAGTSIHRRNNWMLAIKGTSKHVWQNEIGPGQNVYGRYNSFGTMELYNSGSPVSRAASGLSDNGWDWSLLAGTTVEYRDTTHLKLNLIDREFSGEDFLANATFKNNGVFSFVLRDVSSINKFKVNKTVMCFGDVILCLGSNIRKYDQTHKVVTTLFQTALTATNSVSYLNGNALTSFPVTSTVSTSALPAWSTDAVNNGYFYPAISFNQSPLITRRAKQVSKNETNTAITSGNFVTSWIDHGLNPVQGSYVYGIKINGGNTNTMTYAQNFNTYFNIIKLDTMAHVVHSLKDSIYAYVVYNQNTHFNANYFYSTDKPAVIITKQLTPNKLALSLTDPDLGLLAAGQSFNFNTIGSMPYACLTPSTRTVNIKVAGSWSLAALNTNVTTNVVNDTTLIKFLTLNGKSIEIELIKLLPTGVNEKTKNDSPFAVFPVPANNKLNVFSPSKTTVQIIDSQGRLLFEQYISAGTTAIDISKLINGVYFLRNSKLQVKKFVKTD